jgi:serine protease Do
MQTAFDLYDDRFLKRWHNNPLGIDYENLDSQIAEYFGVKQGLLVRYVRHSSVAEKAGLKAGDVVVKDR